MGNSQHERDFNDQSALKRPGRLDFRTLNNVTDAGDGYPGLQKAIRNYFHTGVLEDNIDLNDYSLVDVATIDGGGDAVIFNDDIDLNGDINITGEIVFPTATIHSVGTHIHLHPNIGNADGELHIHPLGSNTASIIFIRNSPTANYGNFQFKIDGTTASLESGLGGSGTAPDTLNINDADWDNINIGDASAGITLNAVSISAVQFGYLGASDQGIAKATSVQFAGLALTGNLTLAGNSITGTSVDINNAEMQQLSNISTATIDSIQWGYLGTMDQSLKQADTPIFNGMGLTGNLVIAGNSIEGTGFTFLNGLLQQLGNIQSVEITNTQWGYVGALDQGLTTTSDITFNSLALTTTLTMSGNIIMGSDDITFTAGGLVDGLDVSAHDHSGSTNGVAIPFTSLSGDITYAQLDSIVDTSGVGTASMISVATHQHTDADGSSKIAHSNTTGRTANDHHSEMPIGFIAMFSGTWADDSTIPGWYKCDGNNGTVNLINKFVRGAATSGATGGSDDAIVAQHNHTASTNEIGSHIHTNKGGTGSGSADRIDHSASYNTTTTLSNDTGSAGDHQHTVSVNDDGVAGTDKNIPAYYALIFIQRIS